MLAYLLAALAHRTVEPLELGNLTRYRIKGQTVPIQHLRKLRVRGDHGSAKGTDRALLPEQRRRVQGSRLPGRPYAGADLKVDMPVRVTRPAGAVRHRHRLQRLDGHDLLLSPRPHAGHGVLGEPPLNLVYGVLLRLVERCGDFGVEGRGDGERLGGVRDHLREPRRSLPTFTRQTRLPHRLPGERVEPVHPARIRLRVEPQRGGHVPVAIKRGERCHGRLRAEVVVIGAGAVGFDIATRVGSGSPEQDDAAMHETHHRGFLVRK